LCLHIECCRWAFLLMLDLYKFLYPTMYVHWSFYYVDLTDWCFFISKLIPTDMRFDANGNPPCYSSEDQVLFICIEMSFFFFFFFFFDTFKIIGDTEGCTSSIEISWYSRWRYWNCMIWTYLNYLTSLLTLFSFIVCYWYY
jgi:hypothetical protein